ncbi:MAG: beta-galactosidase [Candidatus Omnitrophica bacterium]|nr:beta-galactosidase [Candidatus Omnitrophota bacterium]
MEITFDSNRFYLDGKPFFMTAASIHYFRVPPQLWRDRIRKAKDAGFNTIETYIAWNFHEMKEGEYNFSGNRDIEKFINICASENLFVFVRPGPYICSEWDNGALPAWLNVKNGIKFRAYNPVYLKYVDKWFDKLMPIFVKHQYTRGGNIILMQIENEYIYPERTGGKKYLEHLRDGFRKRGIDVPLTACNFFTHPIKGIIQTFNGNKKFGEALPFYRSVQPDKPLMVTEFWSGWFQAWGKGFMLTKKDRLSSAGKMAKCLKDILKNGGMYVYYMFHGGTNFGFWGGRTGPDEDIFMTTSYDFEAPLSEEGLPTEKYYAAREFNRWANEHYGKSQIFQTTLPKNVRWQYKHPTVKSLMNLPYLKDWKTKTGFPESKWEAISKPISLDSLGCLLGYGWYRTELSAAKKEKTSIYFASAGDRLTIYVNKKFAGVWGYGKGATTLPININLEKGKNELLILADNMGRYNFGLKLGETKGISGNVYASARTANLSWKTRALKNFPQKKCRFTKESYHFTGKLRDIFHNDINKSYIESSTTFEVKSGEGAILSFHGLRSEVDININNHSIFYISEGLQIYGHDHEQLNINRYLKPGKNTISVSYAVPPQKKNWAAKDVKVILLNKSSRIKDNWEFQAWEEQPSAVKPEKDAPAWWRCNFKMPKKPEYPVRLNMSGMGKGQIFLNGINIGRYWQIGPQKDYYLPEPYFKKENVLTLFEEEGNHPPGVHLTYARR